MIIWISILCLLQSGAAHAQSDSGDLLEPNPGFKTFDLDAIPMEELLKVQALASLRSFTSIRTIRDRADLLIRYVDSILVRYREGQLTLSEAIHQLRDPKHWEGTGFLLFEPEPGSILKGIPHRDQYRLWKDSVYGTAIAAGHDFWGGEYHFSRPGYVIATPPMIQNGYGLMDPPNLPYAEFYLILLAEESYHAAQILNMGMEPYWNPSGIISEYFGSRPRLRLRTDFESDVYAKMLETLGSKFMPEWLGSAQYPQRSIVNPSEIKLVPLTQAFCSDSYGGNAPVKK